MDPTLENQNEQTTQEKRSEGLTSKGIDTLNNLSFLRNLSGKAGSKAVTQAAGKLAVQTAAKGLFATPVGWVILGIVVVAVIVFVIVFSLGAPPAGPNPQASNQAQPMPTPPAAP